MILKHYFFLLLLCLSTCTFSQQTTLSEKAIVSVITCGAGQDLYASFGHSAFRVQDSALGIDWIYNYGTFDFDTPNFYMKFARGKLLYSLSKQRFENFLYSYQLENRWVKEQILKLTPEEENELFGFLENNYQPENRYYKYDFLFENCSTKMPDVLKEVLGNGLNFKEYDRDTSFTFRELIHQNLKVNTWSSFGIDLALGAVIDKTATTQQYMFLPFYVLRQLDNSELNGKPIVLRERTILDYNTQNRGNYFTTSPLFWLLILFLFTSTITYIDFKNDSRSRFLDFILFFGTGLVGLLVFLLWFFTDHQATANNFNILWAFPLNLIAAFYLVRTFKMPHWLPTYFVSLAGLLILTALVWLFQFQDFSPLLVVVLVTLGVRYTYLYYYFKKIDPHTP